MSGSSTTTLEPRRYRGAYLPRTAPEKSYSLRIPSEVRRILGPFFMGLPLFTSGFPGADESNRVAALGVDDDEQLTSSGSPEEDQALFGVGMVRVKSRKRIGVGERRGRFWKRNPVLAEVCCRLGRIPNKRERHLLM